MLISAATITRIDSPAKKIHVALTRSEIKAGPSIDAADVDPAENLPALWIM